MSEQEKDENNLGSVGEPPPSPPPTGKVVNLDQYINHIKPGRLTSFLPHEEGNNIVNFPYNSNPAGKRLYEKSQGIGEAIVQMYGVLNKYLRDSRNFGIFSPLLGNDRRFMRPTIFSIDKYEVTPRIKDPFMKGGRYRIIQGKGRRRHCNRCDREVTASHIDNDTGSCAYGGPEWNNCRPMGPAIGDEKIIEVDNDE